MSRHKKRNLKREANATSDGTVEGRDRFVWLHLRIGWWSLLLFLSLGIVLEGLHGLKAGFYLDVSNETRRLMWTLAHAHGTLLSLIHIVFAVALNLQSGWLGRSRSIASCCLICAGFLIPLGFFLGGAFVYGGDPGLGILLLPPGALLMLVGVFLTARAFSRPPTRSQSN